MNLAISAFHIFTKAVANTDNMIERILSRQGKQMPVSSNISVQGIFIQNHDIYMEKTIQTNQKHLLLSILITPHLQFSRS